jgi:cytoskeletal protein RodZ
MSTLMNQARNRVPRFAEAAVERARLTVVPRRATKAPRVPFVTLVSMLLVSGVVGLLLFNTHMQQASFTITSMEESAALLNAKEQSLQMRLDTLRDPQKVAARAKKLGMVPSSSPAFIRLSDGKVLGTPTVADPLSAMRITPLPTRKPKNLRPDPVIVRLDPKQTSDKNKADTSSTDAENAAATGTKSKQDSEQRQGSDR